MFLQWDNLCVIRHLLVVPASCPTSQKQLWKIYFVQSVLFACDHPHHFSPWENCEVRPPVSIKNECEVSPLESKPFTESFKLLIDHVSPNLYSDSCSDPVLPLQAWHSGRTAFFAVPAIWGELLVPLCCISSEVSPLKKKQLQTSFYKYIYCSLCCQNVHVFLSIPSFFSHWM